MGATRAQQRGHAGQRDPVLPPGDPGHPPPRHRPQGGVLSRAGGHGQRGHVVTVDDSGSPAAGRAGGMHQAARRRTSQTVAAMSSTDSASSQPPSIHWNGQNRLPGW